MIRTHGSDMKEAKTESKKGPDYGAEVGQILGALSG